MEASRSKEPGLRARKKRETRKAIGDAAVQLFRDRGFQATTVSDVAEAAGVAPRTVYGYFPAKEDLVFAGHMEVFEDLEATLDAGVPGRPVAVVIRNWLLEMVEEVDPGQKETLDVRELLDSTPALRSHERVLQARAERVVANAVARELDVPADGVLPHMVGAAIVAALDAMGQGLHDAADGADYHERGRQMIDDAMAFVGAGVEELAGRAAVQPTSS